MQKKFKGLFWIFGTLFTVAALLGLAYGYGYQYMKENRKRADQRAERIFVTPNEIIVQIYEPLGPISAEAKTREYCLKKIKRAGERRKGDGIIAYRVWEVSPGKWRCEGTLLRLIESGSEVPLKAE